jgi:hypothetical protein
MPCALGAHAARARIGDSAATVSLLASVLVAACLASASSTRAAEPPPRNRLELGFEERVRGENWDNVADFSEKTDDARHQWRFRTRLWAKYDLGSKAELMLGLNNESRRVTHPVTDFVPDEIIFETLYLDYRFADDVHLKVGRQNITKGEGFLFFDAGPLDGSRTQYFNAVDLSYAAGQRRFDLYAISDPHGDRYLPRFDDKQKPLIEPDEHALGLYYTDGRMARTTIDAYYVFKTETGDTRPLSNVARLPDRALHTLGGRAVWQPGRGWEARAELAGQLGAQQPAADIHAWGGTASVKRPSSTRHGSRRSCWAGWASRATTPARRRTRAGTRCSRAGPSGARCWCTRWARRRDPPTGPTSRCGRPKSRSPRRAS